jgi:transcriptional regulator with XRE-family HTH domain
VSSSEQPEDFVHRVTRRIAALRQSRGMTQEQFAGLLGTAPRNVRRIEAGQNLTLHTLARIARALGVAPDDLLTAEGDRRRARYAPAEQTRSHAIAEESRRRVKKRE